MAEAITYADLKFVKAPLKNSVSSPLGQDSEAYEDGELTYENVQLPSAPGAPSAPVAPAGLVSSGLGDKAGLTSEQPTWSWSSATLPAPAAATAERILRCPIICPQYFLLGLLLTCLLFGVSAICLGVRYFQVSRQLQQMTRVLEATNSSLRQQLRLKITQLGQKEEDLQGSRRELAQSQDALQEKQRVHQDIEGQLQTCRLEEEKTRETLRREEEQRRNLDERLRNMQNTQNTLKGYFRCPSPDTCCPLGWVLYQQSCLYISSTQKSWEQSEKHCSSLSARLVTFGETFYYYYNSEELTGIFNELLNNIEYWVGQEKSYNSQYLQSKKCFQIKKSWRWLRESSKCTNPHPFICQLDVVTTEQMGTTLP